jgi:hypothetical protein
MSETFDSNDTNFIPENKEYTKCAPSKKYTDGSCFTIGSLQKIAEAHNRFFGGDSDKLIKISESKKDLVTELTNRISKCGTDQLCWLDINWVKQIKDYDIHNNTFRPKGPQGRFKWLSTTNINDIMGQYEQKYVDFKFLGAVPIDFEDLPPLGISDLDFDQLFNSGKKKIGLVINLDEHWKKGSHWVSMFANLENNNIYYFDSYGIKPRNKITEFVKKIALWCYKRNKLGIQYGSSKDKELNDTESNFMRAKKNKYEEQMNISYNKIRHQFKNSECGVYSVNFILRLLKGELFDNICSNITTDDQVNECRKVYFRFK